MSQESFVGICFENLQDSPTIASLQEHYICFTDNLLSACDILFKYIVKQSSQNNRTFHIEKYDMSVDELHSRDILPYPINFYTFNESYECICNRTNDVVWSAQT